MHCCPVHPSASRSNAKTHRRRQEKPCLPVRRVPKSHTSGSSIALLVSWNIVRRPVEPNALIAFRLGLAGVPALVQHETEMVFSKHAEDQLVAIVHLRIDRRSKTIHPQPQTLLQIFSRNHRDARFNLNESSFPQTASFFLRLITALRPLLADFARSGAVLRYRSQCTAQPILCSCVQSYGISLGLHRGEDCPRLHPS